MPSSPETTEGLIVVALGGNALSPPAGESSYAAERVAVRRTARELESLAAAGHRLLIIHGNGPQVGRLMRDDVSGENLDIHVAQTQGELGYLLTQELTRAGLENTVCLVTRALVRADDPGLAHPSKAVGPVLATEPAAPSRRSGTGWRVLVGSPRPEAILELPAITRLLETQHVIAGGGGGVAVSEAGDPVQGVVDKDWVAAALAIALGAEELLFVTDVAGACEGFASPGERLIELLDLAAAEAFLAGGAFGEGSMAPKVESAVAFVRATGGVARITALGSIEAARRDAAGTRFLP